MLGGRRDRAGSITSADLEGLEKPLRFSKRILKMHESEKESQRLFWSGRRRLAGKAMEHRSYEVLMAVVVVINATLIIYDTDARADKTFEMPWWQRAMELCFLAFYAMDVTLRLYIYRLDYFFNPWNILDFVVVVSDMVSEVFMMFIGNVPSFGMLRICRIFRLMRFVRILALFRELHIMLTGFLSALRAMVWASVMLLMLITLWSIVAVEILHPINMRVAESGHYGDCDRCKRAFSSVFASNLTLLQQVIAGDSWGEVSLPIIEEEPATSLIFFAVLITVNLGLLNLILTVIVDVANRSREADDLRKIEDRSNEFMQAKKELSVLFKELDANGSGELSLDELIIGIRTNPRFSTAMAALDVSPDDMSIMFGMLDEDGSGSVSYREFVEQLYKLKSQDNHSMLIYIRAFVQDVQKKVNEQLGITKREISARTEDLVRDMKKVLYGSSLPVDSTLQVKVEGARGLRTGDSIGATDPYCVCEIIGKPDTRIESPLVEDSLDPEWQFEDDVDCFALGDALLFTVWGRDALSHDYELGRAVLTTEDIVHSKEGFDGELQLIHSGEHLAFLRVQVSTAPCDQNLEVMRRASRTSLRDIDGKIQQLMQRVEGELMQNTSCAKSEEDDAKGLTQQIGSGLEWQTKDQIELPCRVSDGSISGLATQVSAERAGSNASSDQNLELISCDIDGKLQQLVQRVEDELVHRISLMKIEKDEVKPLAQQDGSVGGLKTQQAAQLASSGRTHGCGRLALGPVSEVRAGSQDIDLEREVRPACDVSRV